MSDGPEYSETADHKAFVLRNFGGQLRQRLCKFTVSAENELLKTLLSQSKKFSLANTQFVPFKQVNFFLSTKQKNFQIKKKPNSRYQFKYSTLIQPPNSNFRGLSKSVRIFGDRGILCMWQLVFASRHRLIPNNKKRPKGCLMVMADPLDLGSIKSKNKSRKRKKKKKKIVKPRNPRKTK